MPGPDGTDEFEVVRKAIDDYLSADPAGAMSAEAVFDQLNDGDETTTPFVVSVRAPEHYAVGHVPGAVNVPWRTVGTTGSMDDMPEDQMIVVYCYTGHTGAVATLCMNAMGHQAVNMKYGMTAWTRDEEIRAAEPFNEETGNDFPLETTINVPDETFDPPMLHVTDSTDAREIVRAAADAYLTADTPPVISAADLFDLLNDGDETNDPFVISVRSSEHYALGHIPGAVNIPWKTIAKMENLEVIPPDRDIVVYC